MSILNPLFQICSALMGNFHFNTPSRLLLALMPPGPLGFLSVLMAKLNLWLKNLTRNLQKITTAKNNFLLFFHPFLEGIGIQCLSKYIVAAVKTFHLRKGEDLKNPND